MNRVRVALELFTCAVLAAWVVQLIAREALRRPGSGEGGWSW